MSRRNYHQHDPVPLSLSNRSTTASLHFWPGKPRKTTVRLGRALGQAGARVRVGGGGGGGDSPPLGNGIPEASCVCACCGRFAPSLPALLQCGDCRCIRRSIPAAFTAAFPAPPPPGGGGATGFELANTSFSRANTDRTSGHTVQTLENRDLRPRAASTQPNAHGPRRTRTGPPRGRGATRSARGPSHPQPAPRTRTRPQAPRDARFTSSSFGNATAALPGSCAKPRALCTMGHRPSQGTGWPPVDEWMGMREGAWVPQRDACPGHGIAGEAQGCVGRGGGCPRPPLQGAQPRPSHCPPDAKCQPQWHL